MPLLPSTISTYAYSDVSPASNRSSPVRSAQTGIHARLDAVVQRHQDTAWQLKPHASSVEAFRALERLLDSEPRRPLVFDSGCGTGISTRHIARLYPTHWVIGIDQSEYRLARTGATRYPCREGNIIWLRAELATFWFQAGQAGWKLSRHYLLYPNPWPKASQLRRRWHAHPVFPTLLQLGGVLELRCNWLVYAQEFAAALRLASSTGAVVDELQEDSIRSAFEIKYRDSGLPLYRVRVNLDR